MTAIDANDFTGEREYTLTVDAPEIVVTVPSLPGGTAGTPYEEVTFTAEGGKAPYSFAMTAGGTCPSPKTTRLRLWPEPAVRSI